MVLTISHQPGRYRWLSLSAGFFSTCLPGGFYKIRYFGFLSLSQSKEFVGLVFELLEKSPFLQLFVSLNGMEIY